jgi:hypothetical protein
MRRTALHLITLSNCVGLTYGNSQSHVRCVTITSGAEGPSALEASTAAKHLREDGVVVLKCAALVDLAPPVANAKTILADAIARVDGTGLDSDQPFSFAEICHRSPRRYDVHLGAGSSLSEFSTLVNRCVRPVLALCMSTDLDQVRIIRDGLVTSLPGASAQPFHADGQAEGLFNAFLPLVRVTTHGTEFWIGSHTDEGAARRLKRADTGAYAGEEILDDDAIARRINSPILGPAEGIVLFDYRVVHRGRGHGGHESGPRPVFYRVFAVAGAAEDTHNWPERSLSDV